VRELKNGIKIIGTDLGYGNCKGANTVLPSGIISYDTEPVFQGNILEYDNKYYRLGEGHKAFLADKSMDDDFYILNLAVIARELQRVGIYEAKIYLATGLPLTWVRVQRDSFRAYLMKNKEVKFKFNDKEFHIEFVGCSVYPQGYPAVVERIGEFKGTNLLADIGNGTLNVLYIQNKKPVESKSWTEKLGVNQLIIKARNSVMDNFGVKIDEGIIEQYIRFAKADISAKYEQLLRQTAAEYTNDIFTALKSYEYDPELMKLYIIGGGGCIVKNFGTYDKENVEIISDICATVKGYEHITYLQMRKEQSDV
jgi:plasmid segregation protein ParM